MSGSRPSFLQPLRSPGQMSFSNCTRLFGLMPVLLSLQLSQSESDAATPDTPGRHATSPSSGSQHGQKGGCHSHISEKGTESCDVLGTLPEPHGPSLSIYPKSHELFK
ncbi:hypothetical protein F4776DRAFT_464175 [Hypoxylon sp. NC0597]|nr:hypothetical protein F4776DRAFT_464175 [Hypoxylon sp. NC0597]